MSMKKNTSNVSMPVIVLLFVILCTVTVFSSGCTPKDVTPENTKESQLTEQALQSEDAESLEEGSGVVVTYQQITQEEAKRLMAEEKGYIILDVRTQAEYADGHIAGAICVPNEEIIDQMPAELPDLNQLILVYCRSGNRSKQASQKLADMGYTNVKEFGGINTWDGEIE